MKEEQFPVPIARLAMKAIPSVILQQMTDILIQSIRHNHPGLFRNLARLDAASVRFKPLDVPHQFILKFGQGPSTLLVTSNDDMPCNACITGRLNVLLDLLEGRLDSDMSFFSRDLEISGDTSVIVALRNTLDREEINLTDDIAAIFGPFASPVRVALTRLGKVGHTIKNSFGRSRDDNQLTNKKSDDLVMECDKLREEVKGLKLRLAKFEIRQKRTEALT